CQAYLSGGFPQADAPDSAFLLRQEEQLSENDTLYRHRDGWSLVVKPLRTCERDMLTWMHVAEPLPESVQRFFATYVHDSIAHTPATGDLYFQRRSVFFRHARPWRG